MTKPNESIDLDGPDADPRYEEDLGYKLGSAAVMFNHLCGYTLSLAAAAGALQGDDACTRETKIKIMGQTADHDAYDKVQIAREEFGELFRYLIASGLVKDRDPKDYGL